MPNARAHKAITVLAQISTFPLVLLADSTEKLVFLGIFEAGIGLTYLVNPDTDIAQKLGKVGEFLGFEDYEDLMAHRSGAYLSQWRDNPWKAFIGSHVPITGTLVRLSLILIPLAMIGFVIGWKPVSLGIVALILGASWSDLWHVIADVVVSRGRRIRREIQIRR